MWTGGEAVIWWSRKARKERGAELERVNRVPIQSGYSPRWVPTLCDIDIYVDPDCPPDRIYLMSKTEARTARWPVSNLVAMDFTLRQTYTTDKLEATLYDSPLLEWLS